MQCGWLAGYEEEREKRTAQVVWYTNASFGVVVVVCVCSRSKCLREKGKDKRRMQMFLVTFLFKPSRVNLRPTKEKEYNRRRKKQRRSRRYTTNFKSAQTAVPKMETLKVQKRSKKKAVRWTGMKRVGRRNVVGTKQERRETLLVQWGKILASLLFRVRRSLLQWRWCCNVVVQEAVYWVIRRW